MDSLLINVVDLGDLSEVEAPMSVLAPQDPEALLIPGIGSPLYYDYEYEGMPHPLPIDDFIFEAMPLDSPMLDLRDFELVNPRDLPGPRQNSVDSLGTLGSESSGDCSQDSRDSGSQNSTSDISEYEMVDDLAEELGVEPRLEHQAPGRTFSTHMISRSAMDDDECLIVYAADSEWDKTQTPPSTATPTATLFRPVTSKRGRGGNIDLDGGGGPSRFSVASRRSQ